MIQNQNGPGNKMNNAQMHFFPKLYFLHPKKNYFAICVYQIQFRPNKKQNSEGNQTRNIYLLFSLKLISH